MPRFPIRFGRLGWPVRVTGLTPTRSYLEIEAISIDPPARARMLGLPVSLRELRVSIDDPEALVAALVG